MERLAEGEEVITEGGACEQDVEGGGGGGQQGFGAGTAGTTPPPPPPKKWAVAGPCRY
jgi:hypothetical protein